MSSTEDDRGLLDDEYGEETTRDVKRGRKKHRVFCGIKCDGFAMISAGMTVFSLIVTIALVINIIVHKSSKSDSEITVAVATDSPTCSAVAVDLLKRSGTAVDAAVGALLCLGVVHPHSSGIGGGGFMVVKNASDAEVIDFREVAPAMSSKDMYHGSAERMLIGGLAVGVPGEVRGLYLAYQRHGGKFPWKELVLPAVKLAREGFPAELHMINALNKTLIALSNYPGLKKQFLFSVKDLMPDGTLPKVNQTLTRPKLADTLEKIAESAASFYEGELAQSIADAVTNTGGILTTDDLKKYLPKLRTPTEVRLNSSVVSGWRILGAPPPASGAVLGLIAGIVDGYGQLDDGNLSYHRMVEAFKFAYGQRSLLGDPGFNYTRNVSLIVAQMLSRRFADELRGKISDDRTFNVSYYGGQFDVEETPGTTHVCVLRGDDAVAVTSTINTYFGSLVFTTTGIILNNEMNDFSAPNITNYFGVPPSTANFVEPLKKPLSSMAPTLVVDSNNKVRVVVGASGGTKITTVTFQVLADMIYKNMSVQSAVIHPRLHHQLRPDYVMTELDFSKDVISGLEERQHIVNDTYPALAVCQAIHRSADGIVTAHSDPRKGGLSIVETLHQ